MPRFSQAAQRAALEAERLAWADVKESMPGSPTYDATRWKTWTEALHALTLTFGPPASGDDQVKPQKER